MEAEHVANNDRLVAPTRSRRELAVLGLAGALGMFTTRDTSARKRGNRRCRIIRCAQCTYCRRGQCLPAPDGTACGMAGSCLAGACLQ